MPECRDVLCRTGDLLLPVSVRRVLEMYWIGNERSWVYITNWSIVHAISGVLTALLLQRYAARWPVVATSFWIHTAWELWQILVQNTPWWTLRGWVDIAMDTTLFMLGVLLATRQ
jgi:hypothetical protein